MAQEDKDLLFKDFCARYPYKLKVKVPTLQEDAIFTLVAICEDYITVMKDNGSCFDIYNSIEVFPFLRPMSSMTEEEEKEYAKIVVKSQNCSFENSESATTMANDWLLSKGFDVRGLISKGLAIEVTEENNPYEK